jgi:hypothetical protein
MGCRTRITSGLRLQSGPPPRPEGSRIRDVPPADSEAVYRPSVEKTYPAAAPFRCGRFYDSFAPNVVNIRPIPGRRVYPSAIPKKIRRRRHPCELYHRMQRPSVRCPLTAIGMPVPCWLQPLK